MTFFKTPYSKKGFFGTPYNGSVAFLLIKTISEIIILSEGLVRLKSMVRDVAEEEDVDEFLSRSRVLSRSLEEEIRIREGRFRELVHLTHPRPAPSEAVAIPTLTIHPKEGPVKSVTPVQRKNPTAVVPDKTTPDCDH